MNSFSKEVNQFLKLPLKQRAEVPPLSTEIANALFQNGKKVVKRKCLVKGLIYPAVVCEVCFHEIWHCTICMSTK